MRKHRTLLRRLWRNTPPQRVPLRVYWYDGENTTLISGDPPDTNRYKTNGDTENGGKAAASTKTASPSPDAKPNSK